MKLGLAFRWFLCGLYRMKGIGWHSNFNSGVSLLEFIVKCCLGSYCSCSLELNGFHSAKFTANEQALWVFMKFSHEDRIGPWNGKLCRWRRVGHDEVCRVILKISWRILSSCWSFISSSLGLSYLTVLEAVRSFCQHYSNRQARSGHKRKAQDQNSIHHGIFLRHSRRNFGAWVVALNLPSLSLPNINGTLSSEESYINAAVSRRKKNPKP